jgi:hypothetical protein
MLVGLQQCIKPRIAMGVLMSEKALFHGELNARTPRPQDMGALLRAGTGLLRYVHYFSRTRSNLIHQLDQLMTHAHRADGIQINIPWPPVAVTQWFRRTWPDKRIILQLGKSSFEQEQGDVHRVIERVQGYMPDVTDVLIDRSGGTGEALVLDWTANVLEEFRQLRRRGLGICIAGGLGAKASIDSIADTVSEFSPVSLDAESALRVRDVLSPELVKTYVESAAPVVWRGGEPWCA